MVTSDEVRDALESENWDLCQGGLELGFRFAQTQLEQDAVWNVTQEAVPAEWLSRGYSPSPEYRDRAIRRIASQVSEVLMAEDVRPYLPKDHPQCPSNDFMF